MGTKSGPSSRWCPPTAAFAEKAKQLREEDKVAVNLRLLDLVAASPCCPVFDKDNVLLF